MKTRDALVGVALLIAFGALVGEAADRYFVASPGNWNTTASWSLTSGGASGASVPGSGDVAIFDGSSGACTIDANVNVVGMLLDAAYGSSITQTGSLTMAIGTSHYTQNGGSFVGGAGDITISSSGNFTLNGGSFTAPTGTLWVGHNMSILGGSFIHNNGTVALTDYASTTTATLNAPGITFYDLDFRANGNRTLRMTNTCTVAHTLYNTTTPPTPVWGSGAVALGPVSITLLGNFLKTNSIYSFAIPLVLTNAAHQDLGVCGGSVDGALTVNKPAGVVTIRGAGTFGGALSNVSGVVTASVAALSITGDILLNTNSSFTISEAAGPAHTFGRNTTIESNAVLQVLGGKFITTADSLGNQILIKTNGVFNMNGGTIKTYDIRNLSTLCSITNVSIIWSAYSETIYAGFTVWSNMTIQTQGNSSSSLYEDIAVAGDMTVGDISGGPYVANLYAASGVRTIRVGRNFTVGRNRTDVTSTYGDDNLAVLIAGTNSMLSVSNGAIWSGRVAITNGAMASLATNFIMSTSRALTIYSNATLDLAGYAITSGTMTVSGTLRLRGGESVSPNPTLNAGSAVRYDGAAAPVTIKNWGYKRLDLSAPGKQFNFTASTTHTVAESFAVVGTALQPVVLRSTSGGTYAGLNVNPAATLDVRYVDVQDNDASPGKTILCTKSTGSHTLNWDFFIPGTVITLK